MQILDGKNHAGGRYERFIRDMILDLLNGEETRWGILNWPPIPSLNLDLVKNHNRGFVCGYGHDGRLIHRSANSAARRCFDPVAVNSSLNEAIHESTQPGDKGRVGGFTL